MYSFLCKNYNYGELDFSQHPAVNDTSSSAVQIVSTYARRWRIENGIAEAVKFFHLNALSSPILIKVHFDILMTVIADTLYWQLAQQLRGFEHCDAPKVYRHVVRDSAAVQMKDRGDQFPHTIPWPEDARLTLKFK